MGRDFLPRQGVALIDGANRTSTPFYVFLQSLERAVEQGVITRDQFDALQRRVKALEDAAGSGDSFTMIGSQSVIVYGTPANGFVQLALDGDIQAPGVSWYYGTGPDGTKGFYRLYDAMQASDGVVKLDSGYVVLGEVDTSADLPPAGNVGEAYRVLANDEAGLWAWSGAAWVLDAAATGVVGFRLADLADAGGGTLRKFARDTKGRVSGTSAATSDDLAEGVVNLYAHVYTHTQASASATWTINHNLGFNPAVELLTVGGAEFDAEVLHTSVNQTVVYLTAPLAGTARLN